MQDSAIPIKAPETSSAAAPPAAAMTAEPDDIDPAPAIIVTRSPKRSAIAPTGACDSPQTIFWIARDSVKSAALDAEIAGDRRQEQAEALPQPHAEAEQDRGADQNETGLATCERGGHFPKPASCGKSIPQFA